MGALQALVKEESRPVRLSIAQLIDTIARITIPKSKWDTIIDDLFQLCLSPKPEHREVALYLFESLIEFTMELFTEQQLNKLYDLLKLSLHEGSHYKVRIQALKCVGTLVPRLAENDDSIKKFREYIPMMMEVIHFCITNKFDEEAVLGLGTFDDLVETALPVIQSFIPVLVKFVLSIGARKDLDLSLRVEALTFVQWVARFKPKALILNGLIPPILEVAFPMAAEEDDGTSGDFDVTAHKYASQLLDSLGKYLPTSKILSPAMMYVDEYTKSNNAFQRRAALSSLMALANGCNDIMSQNLENLLPYLTKGMVDPHPLVREISIVAIGQFSEHLQPEILHYSEQILPLVLPYFSDRNPKMLERACYTLVSLVQALDKKIVPFLDLLMNGAVGILKNGKKNLQTMAITLISAAAASAKKSFLPYYEITINLMRELMLVTNPEQLELRSQATECAGVLALALGKEVFQGVAAFFLEQAIKGLSLNDGNSNLKEYTYAFFAHFAEAWESDIVSYLPVLLPLVLNGCDSIEDPKGDQGKREELEWLKDDEAEGDMNSDSDDEDVDDDANVKYIISSSFADEKLQALHALNVLALASGPHFVPHVLRCLDSIEILIRYIQPNIRKGSLPPLENFMLAVHLANPPEQKWQSHLPPNQPPNILHPDSKAYADRIIPLLIYSMVNDDEKRVVAKAQECLGNLIKVIGPGIVHPYIEDLTQVLSDIINGNATCQQDEDEDDPNYDDEDEEEGEIVALFNATTNLIVDLAKVYGPYFLNLWYLLDDLCHNHLKPTSIGGVREDIIGSLAEICRALGQFIRPKFKFLASVAILALQDSHNPVRSNGAFFTGVLCEHGGDEVVECLPKFLELLIPLLQGTDPTTLDNLCGALGRIITVWPQAVPLPQVLPLFIKKLPLRKDFQESHSSYGAIISLFHKTNEAIVPFIPEVFILFSDLVSDVNVPTDIQAEMAKILKVLVAQYGSQLNQKIGNHLSPKQRENISRIVQ
eukprot:TRINITY_DN4596_c0_g1_i1.p1 TRINITY_DN4596_c0_g1~~TRINITY_DN4596_c0_g1_i1.p1  ORF type:complete len:1095 (-),score=205.07 TRINITY_DN4596_c0_g1_i1:21-3005(-)